MIEESNYTVATIKVRKSIIIILQIFFYDPNSRDMLVDIIHDL